MFLVVCDHSNSQLKDKQCKQKTSQKRSKTKIKILTNPGLALSGFEQRTGHDEWPDKQIQFEFEFIEFHFHGQPKPASLLRIIRRQIRLNKLQTGCLFLPEQRC